MNGNSSNPSNPDPLFSSASTSSSRPTHPLAASHQEDSFSSFDSSQDLSQNTLMELIRNGNGDPGSSSGVGGIEGNGGLRTGVENGTAMEVVSNDSANESAKAPVQDLDQGKFKPMFEGSSIDKREFIRLTLQSLKDLGYQRTAASLEQESGLQLESPSITSFRQAVLNGDWKVCEKLLLKGLKEARIRLANQIASDEPSQSSLTESGGEEAEWDSVLREPATRGLDWIKFILHQQRYLELLESRQTKKALEVLRKRLAPLAANFGTDRLHQLSSLVVCATAEELKSRAGWDGSNGNSRREVLHEVEGAISPQVMIPSRRLPQLLEQAQAHQKYLDPFYNQVADQPLSLYTDHISSRSVFPTHNSKEDVLLGHEDEVWHLEWNHRGDALASCGKDGWIIIWKFPRSSSTATDNEETKAGKERMSNGWESQGADMEIDSDNARRNENSRIEEEQVEASNGVGPSSNQPNSSSSSATVSLLDSVIHIKLLKKLGPHKDSITWLAWSPDDKQILAASDTDILLWDVENETNRTFKGHTYTVGTVAWMPDGKSFVTGGMDGKVNIWSLDGTSTQTITTYPFRIQTLAVSPDSRHLVILSWRATPPAPPSSSATPSTTASDHRNGVTSPIKASTTRSAAGMAMAEGDSLAGGSREMGSHRQQLHFYDLIKKQERGSVFFAEQMHSVTISRDSKFALINQRPDETQLWDITSRTALARYIGHKLEQNVIGNCFGGATQTFVVTGSEDACIYVYHKASGKLIEKLSGHEEGSVNAVAWHPTQPSLFASCGDDQTVRLWRPAPGFDRQTILSPLKLSTSSAKNNAGSNGSSAGAHGRSLQGAGSDGESSSNGHTGFASGSGSNAQNPFPWASSPLHNRGGAASPSPIHSPIFQILANSASSPLPAGDGNETEEDQDEDEDREDEEDEDEEDEDENMEGDEEAL